VSGVDRAGRIGSHYDPLLGNRIARAPPRRAAARRLAAALRGARLHGPATNRELLVRVLEEPGFLDGDTDTGYLDRVGLDALAAPLAGEDAVRLSALAAALAAAAADRAAAKTLGGLPPGWRNVRSQPQRRTFEGPAGQIVVDYYLHRGELVSELCPGAALVTAAPDRVGPVASRAAPRFTDPSSQIAPGSLLAPMPGTVLRVETEVGAEVADGQTLVVLEAMKMEHRIAAPSSGTVATRNVTAGQQVESGAVLAVIEGN